DGREVGGLEYAFRVAGSPPPKPADPVQALLREFAAPAAGGEIGAVPPGAPGFAARADDRLPLDFPYVQSNLPGRPSAGRVFLANVRFSGPFVPYLLILENTGEPYFYR